MYERFTDRARKVMQLANQEAHNLNHEYIGCEHVLLGLVKEGSGVAANALKNLDIDLRKVRQEVEKIVQLGPSAVPAGRLPQTPRCKKAIESAMNEARGLNHNYVGTEHLLLGLLNVTDSTACSILTNMGLALGQIREETMNLLGHNQPEKKGKEEQGSASRLEQIREKFNNPKGVRKIVDDNDLSKDDINYLLGLIDGLMNKNQSTVTFGHYGWAPGFGNTWVTSSQDVKDTKEIPKPEPKKDDEGNDMLEFFKGDFK